MFKYHKLHIREYILIILSSTIFLFFNCTKSYANENVFTINDVEVKGTLNLSFSRDKYINEALIESFDLLMKKILLTRDFDKVNNIKLKQIKKLIESIQIIKESYSKDEYILNIKIIYDDLKVKKFLGKNNISFSLPSLISSLIYPVLFIDDEIQDFNDNIFYKNWPEVLIEDPIINFVLPLEDLDDILEITKMKNEIEKLNINKLVNKYDIKNYVFALIEFQGSKLNIHLKTNFNNNKVNKNIIYNDVDIIDSEKINYIIKDLKLKVTDLWKEENLINLLMPLSINLKFYHSTPENLNQLRKNFKKISIIDNFTLEEFNIKNSFFKIYYFGNPKKLRTELLKFGYTLKNVEGSWQLYLNE